MQQSPNSKLSTSITISSSKEKVWQALTEKEYLEKWLCNSLKADLTPGSSWEPLGINFWGGDIFVLISSPQNQLALRWALEGYQSLIHFKLESTSENTTTLSVTIEYPTEAEFGFGSEVSHRTAMSILWNYLLVKLKFVSEDLTPAHRVDILKPEGLAIKLDYFEKNNISAKRLFESLFTPQHVEKFLPNIKTLLATGTAEKGMDEISWDTVNRDKSLCLPVAIKKVDESILEVQSESKLVTEPMFIRLVDNRIEFIQHGFGKRVELQNLFEMEWATFINLCTYHILNEVCHSTWFDK